MSVLYIYIAVALLLLDVKGDNVSKSGYQMVLKKQKHRHVTIPSGSAVIFQCSSEDAIPENSRIAWMRQETGNYVFKAYIDYKKVCLFNNENHPSLSITVPCTPYESNVVFKNISEQDSGNWSCWHFQLPSGTKQSESDSIYLDVRPPGEPSTQTSQSSSSSPSAQPLAASSPDVAVIGGSVGAAFVILAAAVTGCMVMKARRSSAKNSQSVTINTSDSRGKDRYSEMVMEENIVYESHDLQPEGDYALIKDDASPQTGSHDDLYTEVRKTGPTLAQLKELQPAAETTGAPNDVYAEVRKTGPNLAQQNEFQTAAEITGGDVYSVVKKPLKH